MKPDFLVFEFFGPYKLAGRIIPIFVFKNSDLSAIISHLYKISVPGVY